MRFEGRVKVDEPAGEDGERCGKDGDRDVNAKKRTG